MSDASSVAGGVTNINEPSVERFLDFYEERMSDEIAELAQGDGEALYIEYDTLYRHNRRMAEVWEDDPDTVQAHAEEALSRYQLPADVSLEGYSVRLRDSHNAMHTLSVSELASDHLGQLVALDCVFEKATQTTPFIQEGAFECQRCGTMTYIPQERSGYQEPHECQGCERQGPFRLDNQETTFIDSRRVRLAERPEERETVTGQNLDGEMYGGLCRYGEDRDLMAWSGTIATVLATYRPDTSDLSDTPHVGAWLEIHSIAFESPETDDVEIEPYREQFERLSDEPEAIDLVAESIAPRIHTDGREDLEDMMLGAVAWLFNCPRMDPDGLDGALRGDLHYCLVGDPGTGKTQLLERLDKLAPKCVYRSGDGLSKVGLTAAAVQDDFDGESNWTISPGVLPRADGGHCIIDEVDKSQGDQMLDGIHTALEGNQTVKVDKAGVSADLPTRTALLAVGNPVEGAFNPYEPLIPQIDLDRALISRMDVILTVQDIPEPDFDSNVAHLVLDSADKMMKQTITEESDSRANEFDMEKVRDDSDTEPKIPTEVLRAWVAEARQNCLPNLSDEARRVLDEMYIEVRRLNDDDAGGGFTKAPTDARVLEAGFRASVAFARVELSETIEAHHAERAAELMKSVVDVNYDSDTGEFDSTATQSEKPKTQFQKIKALKDIIREQSGGKKEGANKNAVIGRAVEDKGFESEAAARKLLESLKDDGVMFPTDDTVRLV